MHNDVLYSSSGEADNHHALQKLLWILSAKRVTVTQNQKYFVLNPVKWLQKRLQRYHVCVLKNERVILILWIELTIYSPSGWSEIILAILNGVNLLMGEWNRRDLLEKEMIKEEL